MYSIEITVCDLENNIDSTESLAHSDLYAAVSIADTHMSRIGLGGFVMIQYQRTDRSGVRTLESHDWDDYRV